MAKKSNEAVDPFFKFYSGRLDKLERDYKINSSSLDMPDKLSSGMLEIDLIYNGGLAPGMFSIAGPEASSKTTLATTILGSAIRNNLLTDYHDPEGSVDAIYSSNILRVESLASIFGRRSPDGSWAVRPKARYYDDNTLETFFNFNKDFLISLPDKRYVSENDTWYYVFPAARDGTKERLEKMGLKIDSRLTKEMGKYYCICEKRGPQAIIFCDSWPALLSEDQDVENKERSKAMAFNARKFSEYLPQVVGRLRRKSVILLGVNQLRTNPVAKYGSPYYEPGGSSLAFLSSVRIQGFGRSVPHSVKDRVETEPSSWDKGEDVYAYKYFKNTKNKQGTPYLDGWVRVWVRDSNGQGRGYCSAWDNYRYLLRTGRIDGKRNKFAIRAFDLPDKKITWLEFKKYCLAANKEQRQIAAKLLGMDKYVDIRKLAFEELKNGTGIKLFNSSANDKRGIEDLEE